MNLIKEQELEKSFNKLLNSTARKFSIAYTTEGDNWSILYPTRKYFHKFNPK